MRSRDLNGGPGPSIESNRQMDGDAVAWAGLWERAQAHWDRGQRPLDDEAWLDELADADLTGPELEALLALDAALELQLEPAATLGSGSAPSTSRRAAGIAGLLAAPDATAIGAGLRLAVAAGLLVVLTTWSARQLPAPATTPALQAATSVAPSPTDRPLRSAIGSFELTVARDTPQYRPPAEDSPKAILHSFESVRTLTSHRPAKRL